jgi:hypothetical protein
MSLSRPIALFLLSLSGCTETEVAPLDLRSAQACPTCLDEKDFYVQLLGYETWGQNNNCDVLTPAMSVKLAKGAPDKKCMISSPVLKETNPLKDKPWVSSTSYKFSILLYSTKNELKTSKVSVTYGAKTGTKTLMDHNSDERSETDIDTLDGNINISVEMIMSGAGDQEWQMEKPLLHVRKN